MNCYTINDLADMTETPRNQVIIWIAQGKVDQPAVIVDGCFNTRYNETSLAKAIAQVTALKPNPDLPIEKL